MVLFVCLFCLVVINDCVCFFTRYKPPELKVVYGADDEPPKCGQESKEKVEQKKREETRLARM
jgi:hypothetical protein